jgi:putative salt-induced outer membrane protein YdiY
MRFILQCLFTIGVLMLAGTSTAQTVSTSDWAPLVGPSAAQTAEPPSEPWEPPAGAAAAELPLPGATELDDATTKIVTEDSSSWFEAPVLWLGPAPWDSGIEVGLNGSSGTSDSLSIHTGMFIKRESRFAKLDFNADYNRTTNGGESTQDNAKIDVTNDWLIDQDSPWTLFASTDLFYDKFAAFNLQTNVNTGVGYRFIHTPELEFVSRVGGGASREFGGPDNEWTPESRLGFEYSQKVSPTQRFYGKFDYYPDWAEIGECRMVADTGWEIELVQPSNLSLKISATDRYDSTPEGAEPHLLNYSVLVLLKL